MPKKTSHGGARKGAGRKPVSDPKISITIYVEQSIIKAIGGPDQVKDECYTFLRGQAGKKT
jgi:hypothetical protein